MSRRKYYHAEEKKQCSCGKICFDKKGAQTKKNFLEKKHGKEELRIYQCPESNWWHLTHQLRRRDRYH